MSKEKPEIKIEYSCSGVNPELDNDIIKAMGTIGYSMWACGHNHVTNIRDLAFDPKEKK